MIERDVTARLQIESKTYAPDHEIHALALDALSDLARQFSREPDFKSLMRLLVMTISGQFSVADVFILLRPIEKTGLPPHS